MQRPSGKIAIITGGAKGMGESTARLFVNNGAKVLITDILDEAGQALATELGDNARYQHLDVSDGDQWQAAVAAAGEMGPLNVLVNNAAILFHASIADTTEAQFMKTVSINQLGVFLGMQAVFESMKAADGGSIINISSIDGLQSKNGLVAYSGSKWAVRGMTKAAALEMGKYGIRVNSVHPGGIYTAMHGSGFISEEQADQYYKRQAIPRVGKTSEVANISLFLASDEASYSTASEFIADGGWHAGLVDPALPSL